MMEVLLFLAAVVFISLSGVMMPGPVFAAALAKGKENRFAGSLISVGHGIVEFPLIAIIALGMSRFLTTPSFRLTVGIIGGAVLLYMGIVAVRNTLRGNSDEIKVDFPYPPVLLGIITTATNPYFLLWWATAGAALVMLAMSYGIVVLVVFAVVHWSCDFIWYTFLSISAERMSGYPKASKYIMLVGGGIMAVFGVWFVVSSAMLLR